MVMKKKTFVEASLILSYDDRKKFADFYNILMVVDKRVQACKKACKNKKKSVPVKARDPTTLKLRRTCPSGPSLFFKLYYNKKDLAVNKVFLYELRLRTYAFRYFQ